jgi:hypothetical protein
MPPVLFFVVLLPLTPLQDSLRRYEGLGALDSLKIANRIGSLAYRSLWCAKERRKMQPRLAEIGTDSSNKSLEIPFT